MVQEFHVVRCYSCASFQSQQVRKDKKFSCKMCGAKQSVRKEYGRGTGKDCRVHVQKLNTLQGNLEAEQEKNIEAHLEELDDNFDYSQNNTSRLYEEDEFLNNRIGTFSGQGDMQESVITSNRTSKWSTYMTDEADDLDDEVGNGISAITALRQKCATKNVDDAIGSTISTVTMESGYGAPQIGDGTFSAWRDDVSFVIQPSLKNGLLLSRNESVCSERKPGPVSMKRSHSPELPVLMKNKFCSGPYSSISSLRVSQDENSQRKFNCSQSVGVVSLPMVNDFPHHKVNNRMKGDNDSVYDEVLTKSGFLSNRQNMITSLRGKACSKDAERSLCSSEKELPVCSLQASRTSDSLGIQMPKRQVNQVDMYRSNVKLQQVSKLQQRDSKEKDERNCLVACIENSSSAAFKKYELADDVEEIDFSL